MSHLPHSMTPVEPPEPRPSALGIVVRHGLEGGWEVLLGLRSRRARFMAGHLVFPGGCLELADQPEHPGALARCASRELQEEAGLVIGPERWVDLGDRVTPPLFPVRFRTRFYLAELPDGASLPEVPPAPAEIESLLFASPAQLLRDWGRGHARIPPPVLPLLHALGAGARDDLGPLGERLGRVNAEERLSPRIEFVPGIWMLPVRSRTLPPATHTNVWMPGGGRFVVVDPGSDDPVEIEALLAVVRRRCGSGSVVEAVLLTHGHPDHAAGAVAVARALQVPLRAHVATLERLDAHGSHVPLETIEDGATWDLDGVSVRALHTPGHHPGHLVFEVPEQQALISGDLVSALSTILVDPGEGDMESYLASLRRAASLDCRTLLPGHGPPVPAAALGHVLAHRVERESRVLAALRAPSSRTLREIAAEAYGDTPEAPALLRERQALAHLIHLERRGLARRDGHDAADDTGADGGSRWIAAGPQSSRGPPARAT